MKKRGIHIELIKRHAKRGLRFLIGKSCCKVLKIADKKIQLSYMGTKMDQQTILYNTKFGKYLNYRFMESI